MVASMWAAGVALFVLFSFVLVDLAFDMFSQYKDPALTVNSNLEGFDFPAHWAMCHNEVNLILGRGGSSDIKYVPVGDWKYAHRLSSWSPSKPKPEQRVIKTDELLTSKDETISWDWGNDDELMASLHEAGKRAGTRGFVEENRRKMVQLSNDDAFQRAKIMSLLSY